MVEELVGRQPGETLVEIYGCSGRGGVTHSVYEEFPQLVREARDIAVLRRIVN